MVKISLTAYWVEIYATADDPSFIQLIQNVSGIHATRKRNTFRCSRKLLADVLYYLRGETLENIREGAAKQALLYEKERQEQTALLKQYGTDRKYPGLWAHQNLGVELAAVNPRYNFFYDTRTGKTRMAYQIMLNAFRAGRVHRCIVFTPSAIIKSWLEDARYFPQLKIVAFYGNEDSKMAALRQPSHIVLWSTGMAVNYLELIKQCKFDMCFFDESSKLKSHRNKISQAMMDYCLTVPYWYNLSATPAPNGEYEYYTQIRTVDPYAFNPAHTHFVTKYFDNISRNKAYEKLIIKPNMKAEFMDIIESCSIYVDQKVMPTAGKEWHDVFYQMPVDSWCTYEEMRSELASEAEGHEIVADTKAAMRAKLCQITSGFVMDTDAIKQNKLARKIGVHSAEQEVYILASAEDARIAALQQLIQREMPFEQVVIWANYAYEFVSLRKLFGDNARYLRGGSSVYDKEEAIGLFKEGKLRYLVAHPLSIGMGINLTEGCNAVYYSIADSWEALKQSSERIAGHINVQPRKCHYWVLQAQSPCGAATVDTLVYNNVRNKRDASTGLLEYLKAGVLDE